MKSDALVSESLPYRAALQKPVILDGSRLLPFAIGLFLPLVSIVGRRESFSASRLTDRVAVVDILLVLFVVNLLFSKRLKMHSSGNAYLFSLVYALSVGLVMAQYHMDADGVRPVVVEFIAVTTSFLYLVAGYNIGYSPRMARMLIIGLALAIGWEAVIVFHDWIFASSQWFPSDMPGRVVGTFRTGAQLGIFGMMAAGILLGLGWTVVQGYQRTLVVVAGCLAVTFTIAGSRRSAMISLALWFGLFLVLGLGRVRKKGYWYSWVMLITLIFLGIIYSEQLSSSFTGQRLQEALAVTQLLEDSFFFEQFVAVWENTSRWLPMGLGIGRGATLGTHEIHNGHLALLVETGFIGLFSFYSLTVVPMFRSWPNDLNKTGNLVKSAVVSFILAAMIMMGHNRLFRDRSFLLFLGLATTLFRYPDLHHRRKEFE